MATNALCMFVEYMKYSPVSLVPAYIPGEENVQLDDLSRLYKLFPNKKSFLYNVLCTLLLHQACQKYNKM